MTQKLEFVCRSLKSQLDKKRIGYQKNRIYFKQKVKKSPLSKKKRFYITKKQEFNTKKSTKTGFA